MRYVVTHQEAHQDPNYTAYEDSYQAANHATDYAAY
jgi:hypothetical protein